MTKSEKLLSKARNNPAGLLFREFETLMYQSGWTSDHQKGSHRIWRSPSGFSVILYKDEDGDWLAHFADLPHISAFSDTPDGALKELATAWEGVKESLHRHNEPVPKSSGYFIPEPDLAAA